MSRPVKAVTFDLWDTMFIDDSDEPKRAAQGLAPKAQARPQAVYDALRKHHDVDFDTVAMAYRITEAAFSVTWHELHVTWSVPKRLTILLKGMGLSLPDDEFDAAVRTLEDMEVLVPPSPVPGVQEALAQLSEKYSLAVVSDTIVSPGRALRQLLENHGLLQYFNAFVFSDEIGCSKPEARVFQRVAQDLNVDLANLVHVGDRDHNDVKGPQALGARAVFFTAVRDRGKDKTSADAICESYADLPAVIDALNSD